jgi:hypothetical protein
VPPVTPTHLAVAIWYVWHLPFEEALARYGARDLPLRGYTQDLLMSAWTRSGWVEPDRRPIA